MLTLRLIAAVPNSSLTVSSHPALAMENSVDMYSSAGGAMILLTLRLIAAAPNSSLTVSPHPALAMENSVDMHSSAGGAILLTRVSMVMTEKSSEISSQDLKVPLLAAIPAESLNSNDVGGGWFLLLFCLLTPNVSLSPLPTLANISRMSWSSFSDSSKISLATVKSSLCIYLPPHFFEASSAALNSPDDTGVVPCSIDGSVAAFKLSTFFVATVVSVSSVCSSLSTECSVPRRTRLLWLLSSTWSSSYMSLQDLLICSRSLGVNCERGLCCGKSVVDMRRNVAMTMSDARRATLMGGGSGGLLIFNLVARASLKA